MTAEPLFTHPELQPDEVLLSNATGGEFARMDWQSKRRGEIAYDGEGRKLDHDDWFPVFIRTDELERSEFSLKEARDRLNRHRDD